MGGGVASSISPSVGEDAVISEYAQYLFSEALAQASISDGSTIKANEMNCSAKIYFKEGCMFQCTSNTKGWYNHDLHWKYNPTHYSIKLEESTHRAQERSQRSLCSMHSEANKSRQVWGWGYLDVFGYFFFAYFRIANKLPWNRVVFGRDRRTLDFNRMSDFSVGQRVEYYSRTLRRLKARQVGNMTAKGDHSTSPGSIEASTCKSWILHLWGPSFSEWIECKIALVGSLGGEFDDRKKLWSEIWHTDTEIRPDGKLKLEHTDGTGVLKVGTIQTLQHGVQHGVTMENCSMLQNKITLFDVASSYF